MALNSSLLLLSSLVLVLLLVHPAHAFGAGNIASIARVEGVNWRHGDIEDTLLNIIMARAAGGKKFSKLDVKRVYFGNWLRDYSQAVDVGTVKYVSAEAIRIMLWVLGFMSFGYGTKEFEVTSARLGVYRPEEHIDNPKDYADNLDARQYDERLRGPVDEERELAIDERTGLKNYIANEDVGITTSAGLVRKLFRKCIELGRRYSRNNNKDDLYEALRLLGTGCHCLEDYAAHSNYTELALIELGERDIFPHVGRDTKVNLQGARRSVYPLVTGTFGGVDFLHSVMGELSDKVTQSEIQELEGSLQQSQNNKQDISLLQNLLNQVPEGIFGGKDEAGKADELQQNAHSAQVQSMHITPKEPEEFTQQIEDIQKQIYPILQWHDEVMQSINEMIEKIPILPDLLEQLQEQINVFVFSLLAPFVIPIVNQVKNELRTGSSEVIQSSLAQQMIVFNDDSSSNPTHSMLSKDHFSNVLNEPAGKIASATISWVVPQIMAAWDDESVDIRRTNDRIIHAVFHHPALHGQGQDGAAEGRKKMFQVVEEWWSNKSDREKNGLRNQLSRDGVEQGRNHKEGVSDSGHGCGKPLGMPTTSTASSSGAAGGVNVLGSLLGGGSGSRPSSSSNQFGKMAGEAVGGGALGTVVGGLVGGVGADLLADSFGGKSDKKKKSKRDSYGEDGSHTQKYSETGYSEDSRTDYPSGGHKKEHKKHEQREESGYSGTYSSEQTTTYSEYESRTQETSYGESAGYYGSGQEKEKEKKREKERKEREKKEKKEKKDKHRYSTGSRGSGGSGDEYPRSHKHGEKHKKHGDRGNLDENSSGEDKPPRQAYGESYGGRPERDEYGNRQEPSYSGSRFGGNPEPSYGSRQEPSYGESRFEGRQEYGGGEGFGGRHGNGGHGEFGREAEPRLDEGGYGGGFGGRREDEFGGRQEGGYGGPPREEFGGGYGGGFGRGEQTGYGEPPREEFGGRGGGGGGYGDEEFGGGRDRGYGGEGEGYSERRY
ncbi:MAG: hypothetical protein M1834_004683 [Cirrosporium novae-zelandiae]|nr:MAG: hypothetical protein M1834_004683 [Cirrosporium novae-zelandiae]